MKNQCNANKKIKKIKRERERGWYIYKHLDDERQLAKMTNLTKKKKNTARFLVALTKKQNVSQIINKY